MAPAHLDSTFVLSVVQVLGAENELEEEGEVHLVMQLQTDKMQICQFVNSLLGQCELAVVI